MDNHRAELATARTMKKNTDNHMVRAREDYGPESEGNNRRGHAGPCELEKQQTKTPGPGQPEKHEYGKVAYDLTITARRKTMRASRQPSAGNIERIASGQGPQELHNTEISRRNRAGRTNTTTTGPG